MMATSDGGSRLVAELADAERGERTRLAERLQLDALVAVADQTSRVLDRAQAELRPR